MPRGNHPPAGGGDQHTGYGQTKLDEPVSARRPQAKFSRTQWEHLKRKQSATSTGDMSSGSSADFSSSMSTADAGLGTINTLLVVAVVLLTLLLGLLVAGYLMGFFN